tara:strand:- start:4567 stop:4734 length:168 start_codon:yes stop_codon:yes gene_type:complete
MEQYRIEYKYLDTGSIGHGSWHELEDKELLESNVKYMNDKHRGEIYHWVNKRIKQ